MINQKVIFTPVNTQGHVCFFYKDEHDRLSVTADFLKQGIDNNEFCVFITSGNIKTDTEKILELHPELSDQLAAGSLSITDAPSAYFPNGSFSPGAMFKNLMSFNKYAADNGYTGLRAAGDMTWLYDSEEDLELVEAFEYSVEKVKSVYPNLTGLCHYPIEAKPGRITESAQMSHPTIFKLGQFQTA